MWWIHIIASIIFVVVLVGKLIHHHARKQKVIKMEASGEFKKFFKLHFVKVPDNRGVIYYSNGPMNIKYDSTNFDLYRTRLTEIPCYSYEDKKTRRYGRGWRICYWLIFAVALVCFLLSLIWLILLKFAPDSVEFLNIEALEMTKEVFTHRGFGFSMGLIAILALVFILLNLNYRKLFISYIPIYLKNVNTEVYKQAMKPIYVKLD